jgi:predicted metal-dependent phosphoesterase TrpH
VVTLPDGWVRVDCHLHTVASGDSVLRVDELLLRAGHCGLDVVCVTDHHEISAGLQISGGTRPRVVVGEEIRTPVGEVLGLFLSERIPYVLPIKDVVARIRAQGGLVCLPHPYDPLRAGVGEAADALCAAGLVDAVEVFNAKAGAAWINDRAAELAERHGLPGTAGSDAHDPHGVGAAYVEMPDFTTAADFLDSLRSGRVRGQLRPHAPRYPVSRSRRASTPVDVTVDTVPKHPIL